MQVDARRAQQTADNGAAVGSTRKEKTLGDGATVPHSSSDQQELASRGTGQQAASRCSEATERRCGQQEVCVAAGETRCKNSTAASCTASSSHQELKLPVRYRAANECSRRPRQQEASEKQQCVAAGGTCG